MSTTQKVASVTLYTLHSVTHRVILITSCVDVERDDTWVWEHSSTSVLIFCVWMDSSGLQPVIVVRKLTNNWSWYLFKPARSGIAEESWGFGNASCSGNGKRSPAVLQRCLGQGIWDGWRGVCELLPVARVCANLPQLSKHKDEALLLSTLGVLTAWWAWLRIHQPWDLQLPRATQLLKLHIWEETLGHCNTCEVHQNVTPAFCLQYL